MTKEALHDAYMAGYRDAIMHKNRSQDLADRHFEKYYREACNTLSRAPEEAPKPVRKRHYNTWDINKDIEAEGQRAAIFYDKEAKKEE